MNSTALRSYLAEFLGVALLVALVLGAGFMAEFRSAEPATGLLIGSIATAAALVALIYFLNPISGAHLNPAVSLALWLRKKVGLKKAAMYLVAQVLGAIAGAMLANLMFEKPLLEPGSVARFSFGGLLGELVATMVLVLIILLMGKQKQQNLLAPAIGLWIFACQLATPTTSFANPAVTIGRALSGSPAGIQLDAVASFVLVQFLASVLAVGIYRIFYPKKVKK